jgi:hypothetical protein
MIVLFASALAFGQNGPTLTGIGYSFPAPVIAPGQVVTLEVAGLKTVLSPSIQKAQSLPLPTALAGIAVTVNQSISQSIMGTTVQTAYKAPILSLNQFNLCSGDTSSDCLMTFITVQVPYELETAAISPPIIHTQIVISEGGTDSKAFSVGAVFDQVHVATSCDGEPWQTGCPSVVAHADGSLVTAQAPAKPGEVVVIYGWGFGNTTPSVKTGEASPVPAAVVTLPGFNGLLIGFQLQPKCRSIEILSDSVIWKRLSDAGICRALPDQRSTPRNVPGSVVVRPRNSVEPHHKPGWPVFL